MIQVVKRDGKLVDFDISKISNVIQKAFRSIPLETDTNIIDFLALKVTADFQDKIEHQTIQVEQIQDSVEKVLSQAGYTDVSKAYILYRKKRENIRALKSATEEYKSIVDSYLNDAKWRNSENSMANYSVGGLMFSNSGAITTNYWLSEIYDAEIAKAHDNGDFHIHDLDMLTGDSAGWSIPQIIEEGLGGVARNINSRPCKHLTTLCNQIMNFLSIVQNEWAGAQSLPSFDSYLAPFVKVDNLSYEDVYRDMENFIYGINMPNRWGNQIPFSTIGLDWFIPESIKDTKVKIQGKELEFTYGDCQKEVEMIDMALLEIYLKAECNESGFIFPIPSIRLTTEFDFENDKRSELLFQLTSKYGLPHFENALQERDCIQSYKEFVFDENELLKKSGGYFGYGQNLGSIGSVSINLPKIAMRTNTKEEFFVQLGYILDVACRSLHIKRQVLTKLLESGLYPYTKQYIKSFDCHFSTIGIIGMHETCLYQKQVHASLMDEAGKEFALEVFDFIEQKLIENQKLYQEPFNLEATPAEGVTFRFAKLDSELLVDKLYYTNSSQLAVDATNDIFEALDHQEIFQNKYTGGTIFNVYLKESLSDWKNAKNLIKTICMNYTIPYFAITPTYSYCQEHGYIKGEQMECPHCHKKVDVYSRVTGYYRCVDEWNEGKLQEYQQRVYFEVE